MGIIEYFITISPVLWEGLVFTLLFTFVGMIAGFFLAVPLCLVSLYTHGIGKKLTDIYVAIIRGTPMLIQLYMIYYGFPKFLLPLGTTVTPYL
ncbi:MAG: ABC transporter permease subunit, partial [Sediminispirochaetaceae bacterium]